MMGASTPDPARAPVERARRYPLHTVLFYRSRADRRWREGRTENVSRSGVLFRTDRPMALHTPIEMLLPLPVELPGRDTATVICRGRVVRLESARDETAAVVAATIVGYRFTRSQGLLPTRG
jgi:hypothetical protein